MISKDLIKQILPGLIFWRNRIYNYIAHYRFKGKRHEQIFGTIYSENHWGDSQSRSGSGSNQANASQAVEIVKQVLTDYDIQFILDIPCGDFNWMSEVNLHSVKYIGADIVTEIVKSNKQKFSKSNIRFEQLNIIESKLPRADLIICRDCLVHFSYKDIFAAIKNVQRTQSTYILVTTFPTHSNHDIITGDWRPLNLQAAPFKFPPPVAMFTENCREDPRYSDKSLALWRIDNLNF